MSQYAFSVIGGDMRQIWLALLLSQEGHIVKVCGFENSDFVFPENVVICTDVETALSGSDYCILGLPCSRDGELLNAPYSRRLLPLDMLCEQASGGSAIFAGRVPDSMRTQCRCPVIDYYDYAPLILDNSVPTAEGALKILIEELPVTVFGASVAVTGYGSVAKAVSRLLMGAGAHVTVFARSAFARAEAKIHGCMSFDFTKLHTCISGYDAIINTVPATVFGEAELSDASSDTLFLDLASKPGGFDMCAMSRRGLELIWALSLPGKVAPKSAALAIRNAVFDLMEVEP